MTKHIAFILASACLSFVAHAQDSSSSTGSGSQSPFSLGARVAGTGFEVDAGFHSGNVYRIGFVVGRVTDEEKTEGGDLNAWQYVEEKSSVLGSYALAQFEARLWASANARHSVRVQTSAGAMRAKLEYSRNRYKPYNGAICPIGSCSKALEEGREAGDEMSLGIARAGLAYSYVFSRDNRGWLYTFDGGLNSVTVLNREERALTAGPYGTNVSSDRIARSVLHAGLNVRF